MDRSLRKSGRSEVKRMKSDRVQKVGRREEEVRWSPEGWTLRGPKSEGSAPNAPRARRKTKAESDEWKQRSNEVGVWVSNIKTKDLSSTSELYLYTCK